MQLWKAETFHSLPPSSALQRQKLQEAQTYVLRLEGAYTQQAEVNGKLQAKVKSGARALTPVRCL